MVVNAAVEWRSIKGVFCCGFRKFSEDLSTLIVEFFFLFLHISSLYLSADVQQLLASMINALLYGRFAQN